MKFTKPIGKYAMDSDGNLYRYQLDANDTLWIYKGGDYLIEILNPTDYTLLDVESVHECPTRNELLFDNE